MFPQHRLICNHRAGDALPVVSPPDDKYRVFAFLDEGCNSTCHTTAWAEHAARVYSGMGLSLGELTGPPKSYSGIGSQKSKGKRSIALAIELDRPLDNSARQHIIKRTWWRRVLHVAVA